MDPEVVDSVVQAHVNNLLSALGGSGADLDGKYILGDDAYGCLRDIRKWMVLHDDRQKRLDVARTLADANFVVGDLLPILASWGEHETDNDRKAKIARTCVELMVRLTWPIETTALTTKHQHGHIQFLRLSQLEYKRHIINYDAARILHTAVRVALPSMSVDKRDRSASDEGRITVVLYFLRNIASIVPPPGVEYDGDEFEVSRSAVIDAFEYQDILHLLLTLCSTMGEDFENLNLVVMEIFFHLVKGVKLETLFLDEEQKDAHQADALAALREQDKASQRGNARTQATRHGRFGTMIRVLKADGSYKNVSGQAALTSDAGTLEKMDKYKKYKLPQRRDPTPKDIWDLDTEVVLQQRAAKTMRTFVEDFLDAGFNPLFLSLRKVIRRGDVRLEEWQHRQYFYLVSWFLEAERYRRAAQKKRQAKKKTKEPMDSFGLVAAVLDQEMLIVLKQEMDEVRYYHQTYDAKPGYDEKKWIKKQQSDDLKAAVKAFTQVLLTVQDMFDSPLEEDQDIAENILANIFYDGDHHKKIPKIVENYKDQGIGYLDAITELWHVFIRLLENYSKQNQDMQVRTRRRTRKKRKEKLQARGDSIDAMDLGNSDDDERSAQIVSKERKFSFLETSQKFVTALVVNTFVRLCSYYRELKPEQLKRCHRFFYRISFKMEQSVQLFRVDIIALFHKMIKGPDGLDPASKSYKEWNEFVTHILRKCTKKLQERPALFVEMLFTKTKETTNYLNYGYEKQTISKKSERPAAERGFRATFNDDMKIATVVGALLDRGEAHLLEWLKGELSKAEEKRRSWNEAHPQTRRFSNTRDKAELEIVPVEAETIKETENEDPEDLNPEKAPAVVLETDSNATKKALFKNGILRLLMKQAGLQNIGDADDIESAWAAPSHLTAEKIAETIKAIKAAEFDPPLFENGRNAEAHLTYTGRIRQKAAYDDDSREENWSADDLFPEGGPTNTHKSKKDALEELQKKRRKRNTVLHDSDSELDDETLQAISEAKRLKDTEKQRKIKSALFVHDSDEESDVERDAEFFAAEEARRKRAESAVQKAEVEAREKAREKIKAKASAKAGNKRKSAVTVVSDDEGDDIVMLSGSEKENPSSPTQKRSASIVVVSDDEDDDVPVAISRRKLTKRPRLVSDEDEEPANDATLSMDADKLDTAVVLSDDDDHFAVQVVSRPRRTRGGFIDDSDDE